jgi:DNA-binding LytR/AlgR family response regulator
MSKIKIGVIEDEVITADSLCSTLYQLGYDVTEPAASYAEALVMIEEDKPDLLLLDIQIKGKRDGIDLAMKINETNSIPFIFLTANADEATVQRAKLAAPGAYLLKPFTHNDLYTAIEVCLHNALNRSSNSTAESNHLINSDSLFIKDGGSFHKVKFSDVLYLESEHVYVQVHTCEKKYLVRTSMQDYLSHFNEQKFFRIHRSYVINLDHLQSVSADDVLINGVWLPLGKTYQQDLFARLKIR